MPVSTARKTILAFGPASWPAGVVVGSPRYHLYGLAGRGYRVLYVEAPQGRWRSRLSAGSGALPRRGTADPWPDRPLSIYHPRTHLFFHPRLPLPVWALRRLNQAALKRLAAEARESLAGLDHHETGKPDILWLGSYAHAPLLRLMPHRKSVAFIYDDLPASPVWNPSQARLVKVMERELLEQVDLAIFTSKVLLDSRKSYCRRALLLENAVSDDFFEEGLSPESLPGKGSAALERVRQLDRPRIGYVGALNVRLDFELCRALAKAAAFRQWQLVLAGPRDLLYGKVVDSLRQLPNVCLPGAVPPHEVPHLLRCFDVLILPHRINDFTRAMFPEKLPEYLATGKPIVSTRLPEVVRVAGESEPLVRFAGTEEDFFHACEVALKEQDLRLPAMRIALARLHTREARLDTLTATLDKL